MSYRDFPKSDATPEEKMSKKYFLEYAKSIYSNLGDRGFRLYRDTDENMDVLLSYLNGTQPVGQMFTTYDNLILNNTNDGSSSDHQNTDWQPLAIAAKYFEIAINQVLDRDFDINASAIDSVAITEMSDRKARMMAYMDMKKQGEFDKLGRYPTDQEMGVEIAKIPETKDELDILFNTNEKHWAAMEAELVCKKVFEQNNYEEIARENLKNAVALGIGAVVLENNNGNIGIKYIPSEMFIPGSSNYEDFRDQTHCGYEELLSYNEFMAECDYPTEVKKKIWEKYNESSSRSNPTVDSSIVSQRLDDGAQENLIRVMRFYFKDYHENYYEKVEKEDGIRIWPSKDSQPKRKNSKIIVDGYNVVKKGTWIMKAEDLIECEEGDYLPVYGECICENMEVSESNPYDVVLPVKVHAPRMTRNKIIPLVWQVKPIIDKMQEAWARHQQYIKEAVPDGNAINLWALENANFTMGGKTFSPSELYKLYRAKGDVLYYIDLEEQNVSHALPFQPITNNNLEKAGVALNQVMQYLSLLREATGINETISASDPDPKMLVGVAQMSNQAASNALGYLYRFSKNIKKQLAEGIIRQVMNNSLAGEFPGHYKSALGPDSMSFWKKSVPLHYHAIGITLEPKPTTEEWQIFYNMLSSALGKGQINEADLLFLVRVDNIKQAEKLFEIRIEKRMREQREAALQQAQAQAQAQGEMQMQAAQIEMAKDQNKQNSEMQKALAVQQMKSNTEREKMYNDLILQIRKEKSDKDKNDKDYLVNLLKTAKNR